MKAFHGKQSIKTKYLNRVIRHKKADELIQDYGYWVDGKGCAVGCTIHDSSHKSYETELGIPAVLAYLEDRIFEGLPKEEARKWPSRFLKAIKPGADLSGVWNRYALWLLGDEKDGALVHCKTNKSGEAVERVVDLYLDLVEGRTVTSRQWAFAAAAAFAAGAPDAGAAAFAADAAYAVAAFAAGAADAGAPDAGAAAAAFAADAAYAAFAADAGAPDAGAAAFAADAAYAAFAADAAYAADAGAAIRKRHYIMQANKLIKLLKEAL